MKVYSRKNLLVSVFPGGGLLVYTLVTALRGDWKYWLWVALSLYLVFSGLRASLTREGCRRDQEQGARYRRATRRLFGPFAPVMLFTPMLLFVLFCSTWRLRPPAWLFLLLMLGVVAYAAWLSRFIRRAIDRERAEEERQSLLNETDKE